MKLLDDYLNLEKQIYEYFGYKEGWQRLPIEDCRHYYWTIDQEEVLYAKFTMDLIKEEEKYFSADIYGEVYETKDFTMILVDTNTDGNKFLQIFDNNKRIRI